jgi:hypothetical protein
MTSVSGRGSPTHQRLAARRWRGIIQGYAVGQSGISIVGYPNQIRKYADPPPAAADDHLENHLLSEENRRLKDELRRAEHALKVAAKVLRPYLK